MAVCRKVMNWSLSSASLSSMLLSEACMAARRLAFSAASDSAKAPT